MKRITLLLSALFLISCQNRTQNETTHSDDTITEIENIVPENNFTSQTIEKNSDSLSRIFLKENSLKLEYDKKDNNFPDFFKIFDKKAVKRYIAFADKTYPQKTSPKYYDHFVLYLVEFNSEQDRKTVFDEFVKEQSENIETLKPIRSRLFAKYGGIITYKGNYIITLVKTCRDTPNGMNWNDYENLFFSIIHH